MLQKDWHAQVEGDKLVHITINDNVVLTDMDLVLLSDTRTSIVKTKVNTREIFLSGNTEKPMFVQIGHSVKYVKGSGGTF
ncbi:MAG: hypothetical protein EBS34_09840, partial [Flavobacteriales bacterium]|nr:hypothetical protein [Flavobacteriales bacterium]